MEVSCGTAFGSVPFTYIKPVLKVLEETGNSLVRKRLRSLAVSSVTIRYDATTKRFAIPESIF